MRSFLDAATEELAEGTSFVIVSDNNDNAKEMAEEFEITHCSLPLYQFLNGLNQFKKNTGSNLSVELPSNSGTPISITNQKIAWLEEELELVHLNIGNSPSINTETTYDFRKGKSVSWFDLALRLDIDRDLYSKLEIRITQSLKKRRVERINLYHEPGSGGSTLGYRILWDKKHTYPCIRIRNYSSSANITEKLANIFSLTKLPTLVLVDGNIITERQANEITSLLTARNSAAVFLLLHRKYDMNGNSKEVLSLTSELSPKELQLMNFELARDVPTKKQQIKQAIQSTNKSEKTLFYLGLIAFEDNYLSIEDYVKNHLSQMSKTQKEILFYLALAHYYGQSSVHAQFFVNIVGLPQNKPVDLNLVLNPSTLNLISMEEDSKWRPIHYLVSNKILELFLTPENAEIRTWKKHLANKACSFIQNCAAGGGTDWDESVELMQKIFIYRDNSEVIGTEKSGRIIFSRLVTDILTDEGKLSIFKCLTKNYPDNHHFWAHLGRFYGIQLSDYPNAVSCLDKAIDLEDKDHVVYHMKGMALRSQLDEMIQDKKPFSEVAEQAQLASDNFSESRERSPENEHSYISDVQTMIRVIDYCGKYKKTSPVIAIANSEDAWVRECFERAENLLIELRQQRQRENLSDYEIKCRASMNALYGDHSKALESWQNVLDKDLVYAPPIRRQIVWTLLARRDRKWEKTTQKEIKRIVDLLELNIEEEPSHIQNLKLWLQAIREVDFAPQLDSIIEKVAYWHSTNSDISATYYLYVLYTLHALAGSRVYREKALEYLEKTRKLSQYRRDRTRSIEWVGHGEGIKRLIHQSSLGQWSHDKRFWSNPTKLEKMEGVVSWIKGPEGGHIEICGMKAFFVPEKAGLIKGRSENTPVKFYLGFSYDGLRAWDVEPLSN